MKRKRYEREQKAEVLRKVREGRKVSSVAEEHGMSEQTVRTWVKRETEGRGSEILEVSRLRRENESLLKLVGRLTLERTVGEKNQRRERRH